MPQQQRRSKPPRVPAGTDDTVERSISTLERQQLGMDSWEPSLLRKLLAAQNRLRKQEEP